MSIAARLVAYTPNGPRLGELPTPASWDAAFPLNDVGALTLAYAETAPRASWLAGALEVALEVSHDGGPWTEPEDARFLRLTRSGQRVGPDRTWEYGCPGYAWVLDKAKVYPNGLLNDDGKRAFLSATPGTILSTLIQEAKARGGLAGLDTSTWSTTTDTAGAAWSQIVTLYYTPGLSILTALQNLAEQGLVDYAFQGRSLRVWNADTARARDLSGSVVLDVGRDVVEAPRQGTLEELATDAFVLGEGGASLEVTNPEAVSPWGRWETFITQGGVSDTGTMSLLADASLRSAERERVQDTYALAFAASTRLPHRDYRPGDYITVRTSGTPERVRVRQVTLTRDEGGALTGAAVLNDRFLEDEVRRARRVKGITGGSSLDGGSGARPTPEGPDRRTPAAPAGVTTASVAYMDALGRTYGLLSVDWEPVTTDVDGAALEVSGYQVYVRRQGETTGTLYPADADTTAITLDGLTPGTVYGVTVRALTLAGRASAWSASTSRTIAGDATAPAVPSTPVLSARLGVIRVDWDGLNAQGGGMPLDFDRVEVALGATATPTAVVGTLDQAGRLPIAGEPYGEQRWVRLRAVDRTGNASGWSTAASVTVAALVDADLGTTTVDERFTQVQQTADGKSTITNSTESPNPAYTGRVGDLWWKRSSVTGYIIGQWEWTASGWQSRTLDGAVLSNINAGAITAGVIAAARLSVGGGSELLVDPTFAVAEVRTNRSDASGSPVTFAQDAGVLPSGGWYAVMSAAGGSANLYLHSGAGAAVDVLYPLPVVPGRVYRFTARVARSADFTATSGLRPTMRMRRASGATASVSAGPYFTPTTSWVDYSWEWTCPADVVSVAPALQITGGTAGAVYVSAVGFGEKVGTTLIQDGAVVTDHLAALAVTAVKIAANAVTADKIEAGAVVADKIAALAVTAAKIAAGAVTADKIAAVLVLASRLVAGTDGAARLELGNLADGSKGLRLYDTNGTTVLVDMGPGRPAKFRGSVEASDFTTGVAGSPRVVMGPSAYKAGSPAVAFDVAGDGVTWADPHLALTGTGLGDLAMYGRQSNLAYTRLRMADPSGNSGHGKVEVNAYGLTGGDTATLVVDAGLRAVTMNRIKVGGAQAHGATAIVRRRSANVAANGGAWNRVTWDAVAVSLTEDANLNNDARWSDVPAGWWLASATVSVSVAQTFFVRVGAVNGQELGRGTGSAPSLTASVTVPFYLPAAASIGVEVYLSTAASVLADAVDAPTRFTLTPLL